MLLFLPQGVYNDFEEEDFSMRIAALFLVLAAGMAGQDMRVAQKTTTASQQFDAHTLAAAYLALARNVKESDVDRWIYASKVLLQARQFNIALAELGTSLQELEAIKHLCASCYQD
jgi:hypothetical protein